VGSQAWADGRTKTNIAPKNVHTLFFLVVGDFAYSFITVIMLSYLEEFDALFGLLENLLSLVVLS